MDTVVIIGDLKRDGAVDTHTLLRLGILGKHRSGFRVSAVNRCGLKGKVIRIFRIVRDLIVVVHTHKIRHIHAPRSHAEIDTDKDRDKHHDTRQYAEQDRQRFVVFLVFLFLAALLRLFGLRLSRIFNGHGRAFAADKLGGLVIYKIVIIKFDGGIFAELVQIQQHFRSRLIPILRVFLHGAHGDLLKAERDLGIDLTRTLGILLELHDGDGNSAVRLERQLTCEHFIHHYADGINIRLIVSDFTARLFGADVMYGADGAFGHGARIPARETRNAEITDLNGTVLQEHDVLGLNVTVDDALVMRMLKRL